MSERRDTAHRAWLRGELPGLVEADVIDAAAAERLRSHYVLDELAPGTSRAVLAFAVMGAGLIGAGILLLVAHNWEEMSRPARAALCVGLLLGAQAVGFFAMTRRPTSDAWREASAAFLTASFGTALSLISQTYHVQGELGDLVLGWVALMVPAAYALDARVTAGALALLSLFLPLGRDRAFDEGYVFLVAMAALGPLVFRSAQRSPDQRRTAWLEVVTAVAFALGTLLLVARDASSVAPVWLLGVFATFYVAARGEPRALAGRALRSASAMAIGVASLVLTYEAVWEEVYGALDRFGRGETAWTIASVVLTAVVLVRLASLGPMRRRADAGFALALVPGWVAFGLGFVDGSPAIAAALFNVFVLGLGILRLVEGLRSVDRGRSNFGLGLLAVLFVLRFFDVGLSFVVRGLGMMLIGAAFLAVNAHLARKRGVGAR